MAYGGDDRSEPFGGLLGTSVWFVMLVYYVSHMDVLVSNMGKWEV